MSTAPRSTGSPGHPLRSHCRRGHAFTEENSYYKPNGHRTCRACTKMRDAGRTRLRNGVADIPRIDGEPWLDLLAAVARRAIDDYAMDGEHYETALEFLAAAGLLTRNGSIRKQ
jgi:hypothetical protein